MNDGSSGDANPAHCEPLLRLATPDMYRRNLFRVLGLPVDATLQDARRLHARRRMQEKLGIAPAGDEGGGLFALHPPPSDELLRSALERLGRPVERFLDEIFWFWPIPDAGGSDAALEALKDGHGDAARRIWTALAAENDPGHLARHNLAVLDHLLALDRELCSGSETGPDVSTGMPTTDPWRRSLARWKEVLDGEAFWGVLRDRVRELDDAQLTTGFVRRVRAALPTALLLTSAKIAYRAAERSDLDVARRHGQLVLEAGFGRGAADAAVREALKPARRQIKDLIEIAKTRWGRAPQHGDRYAEELHQQAKRLLDVVDAMLPADDAVRAGLHDLVAEAIREGVVAFGNKTNDWEACDRVLGLAERIVAGQSVRTKLADDRKTVRGNLESGNDWCAPGYWDLPPEVVGRLEEARAKAAAGDAEGALQLLVVMDPPIGTPLRRCAAYCLVQWSWQIIGEGLDEWRNRPTRKMQAFLDAIRRQGSVPVPSPDMEPWQAPPCPCCGNRNYTRWVNGEYQGQPFWMCSACSDRDDRERREKKKKLQRAIREGLTYALLAAEIDDRDPGVRSAVAEQKELANEVGAGIPRTEELRQRLGAGSSVRRIRHAFLPTDADQTCFFCEKTSPDDACAITVPVCSEIRSVETLFLERTEYRYGEVVVPRCRRCRAEHFKLLARAEAWHEARRAAGNEQHFPELVRQMSEAQHAATEAEAEVERCRKAVEEAENDLQRAQTMGLRCDRCDSKTDWANGVCRRCDRALYRFGARPTLLAAASVAGALVGVHALRSLWQVPPGLLETVAAATDWSVPEAGRFAAGVVYGGAPLFVGAVVAGVSSALQAKRRRRLGREHLAALEKRRDGAVGGAQERLDRAVSALAVAQRSIEEPAALLEEAKAALKSARREAMAAFERLHPEPGLPPGVKAESAYVSFGPLQDLLGGGWGFGREPGKDGQPVRDGPVDVEGLARRKPDSPGTAYASSALDATRAGTSR